MGDAVRSKPTLIVMIAFWLGLVWEPWVAAATSGPGCFQVGNLPAEEPLMVRSKPSVSGAIVGKLYVGRHGIISETGACRPFGVKPSKQWCPITIYDGDSTISGWSKLAFLMSSHCP